MAHAQVCICTHIRSDHTEIKVSKNTRKRIGSCQWYDCTCKGFVLKEKYNTSNHTPIDKDTYIQLEEYYKINPVFKEKKPYKLLISDCDENGIPKPIINKRKSFKKKQACQFNNGEHP